MSVIGRPLTIQTFESYPDDAQKIVKKVRPGLSGIGSILFRGEEEILHGRSANFEFYENVIAYKVWSVVVLNKGLYILPLFCNDLGCFYSKLDDSMVDI